MSTNNPFRRHANNLFASKGCDVDAAMDYASEVLFALTADKAAAMTALMVVVNTAANAFDQARGPSPEKLAIIELIDSRINEHLLREGDIHQTISDWFDAHVDIDDRISAWLSENLDGRMDDWAGGSMSFDGACDNRISNWMSDNFDITDYNVDAIDIDEKVTDWMNEYLESHIGEAINNMDLVVRIR